MPILIGIIKDAEFRKLYLPNGIVIPARIERTDEFI